MLITIAKILTASDCEVDLTFLHIAIFPCERHNVPCIMQYDVIENHSFPSMFIIGNIASHQCQVHL